MIRCLLKEGREKPLEGFHPWIFSGAIDQIDEDFHVGDLVHVFSSANRFLGIGYLNPRSQIAIRMLTFENERIDEAFFEKRTQTAIALRKRFISPDTNAYRVIHSEGDFLPGLIVDRYGEYLVAQFLTAGMDRYREMMVSLLKKGLQVRGIFEKDNSDLRDVEGVGQRVGILWGETPPDFVEILESGNHFVVDIQRGQKTGFFLDQRENRKMTALLSGGRRVLNCFSYTGGFGVYAAKAGASETICVDSSEPALNTARLNYEKNGLDLSRAQFVQADVFDFLRQSRQEFDLVILDPPAFCKSKQQICQASRGYKDINLYALKLVSKGGLLFTFSCSSHISADLFQKIVFAAAKDAKRHVQILAKTSHPFDHPISIFHPEGEYLKGLLCQVR